MAHFERLPLESFQRGAGGAKGRKIDLAPYRDMIDGLTLGEGGIITLETGDQQRTTKRRLTIAAHEHGFGVKWKSAPEGKLRFQLVSRS
jgi:hypothetical protein